MEYPPILPDIEEELKTYLLCPENLPIHQYERNQEFWPRKPNAKELLHFEGSPLSTTLKVQRDLATGEIIGFRETFIESAGANPKNSMSLSREPAPPSEATRGNSLYIPFWPGSFPALNKDVPKEKDSCLETELLTIPPGFERGLVFDDDGFTLVSKSNESRQKKIVGNLSDVNLLDLIGKGENDPKAQYSEQTIETSAASDIQGLPEEDEIIPNEIPVLKISETPSQSYIQQTEWAVLLDTSKPVEDFEEKIPKMARKYKFELDTFQKLAILQLEQHNHVFVAAHTSAGKTVVAEYAIALSQEHRTRTIYTSPIKALSNQKYRDFKRDFKDVGLITGDFQINQKANCLIMTTEILKSMLYHGSDIARDLEYVIFDEVHYINDRERGHVWEQVLIMLPKHVCVVLLSATVPNTMEFADWLGRTHQKKVYVVTTFMRPVPLQHFLYMYIEKGRNIKDKTDRMFKILDAEKWIQQGYFKTNDCLKAIETPKGRDQRFSAAQDRRLWTTLINHLEKNELLPVVAFTFSRQRCDNNAVNLINLDLTNREEKEYILKFFNKCIRNLKGTDQNLPQVVKTREILIKGIGVHHSGILPIIKEIVEMLFQEGKIKLLFATETFAMGVNMPAKTVVFDSVRKHDGKELRDLEPAEYIQMAGRAGRRGLDKEGTVIILCKQEIPAEETLKKMMLGKPSSLVSQFRLTYGMVLSLLRVESLTVEGVMSRSFGEANHQKSMASLKKQLLAVEEQLNKANNDQLTENLEPLITFYDSASNYLQIRKETINLVMATLKVQKALVPGRLVVITQKNNINKLALILSSIRSKQQQYKVLVLSNTSITKDLKEDDWYYMMSLTKKDLFLPANSMKHEILIVSAIDIFEITSKTVQGKPDLIISDVEKRQMERFKDAPPGQSCIDAVQHLLKLTQEYNDGNTNLFQYLHFIIDLKVNEQGLYEKLKTLYALKKRILENVACTNIPDFEEKFDGVFRRKFLEEKKKNLEFMLSNASLSLFPDYENRIKLLRKWNYVDNQNNVELKGRVACLMGTCEMLITELVLRTILTKLKPAEVAALLSPLVYRVKVKQDEVVDLEGLPEDLKKAIAEMVVIHKEIAFDETVLQIQTDEFQQDLNFGLVHVVYEWASDKPFAQIMQLTDIQEGIIVRCIQQLNEIIRDVRVAAKNVGEYSLESKMDEASSTIKRDIVFVQSLYTEEERYM